MSVYSTALWYGGITTNKAVTYNLDSNITASTAVSNQIISLFQGIASVTNLTYTISNNPSTLIKADNTTRSYATYPSAGADIALNTSHFNGASLKDHSTGTYNYIDLLHEALHTTGLRHIHVGDGNYNETVALSNLRANFTYFCGDGTATYAADNLNRAWMSVMSYDYGANPYAVKPMILDVISLGEQYGITNKNNGDTIYSATNGYVAGRYSTEVDTAGIDTVNMSSESSSMVIHLGVDVGASYKVGIATTALGWAAMHASGNVVKNPNSLLWLYGDIENATGGSAADTINGNSLNNFLNGGSGNDILYGGEGNDTFDWETASRGGNDTFYGGTGDDTFVVDSLGDVVVEYTNEGIDLVWASSDYSIASVANVEKLFLFGTGNISGTGSNLNNTLRGNSGNNALDGGAGLDTCVYQGSASNYNITLGSTSSTVLDKTANRDGTDTLTNVERLQFADTHVALDVAATQNAGAVYMLYRAAFNRPADPGGMGYWLAQKDNGLDIVDSLAQGFVNSAEFIATYGSNPSNATFVDKLYQNVLGRAGETDGVIFWNQQLNAGNVSKAAVLVQFATLTEGASLVANEISQGITYTQWLG